MIIKGLGAQYSNYKVSVTLPQSLKVNCELLISCTKPQKGNLLCLVQDILINIISIVELELVTNEYIKKELRKVKENTERL